MSTTKYYRYKGSKTLFIVMEKKYWRRARRNKANRAPSKEVK